MSKILQDHDSPLIKKVLVLGGNPAAVYLMDNTKISIGSNDRGDQTILIIEPTPQYGLSNDEAIACQNCWQAEATTKLINEDAHHLTWKEKPVCQSCYDHIKKNKESK